MEVMAFIPNFPIVDHNGPDQPDGIINQLDRLSKADLENLMNDAEEIKKLAKSGPEVKKSISMKESSMLENRKLAEANLAMEPSFLAKRQELVDTYARLAEAAADYQRLKLELDCLSNNYSPSTVLALMQAATAQLEEQSEKFADQFVNESLDADRFLEQFLPLRKLCNERRFKSEKLAEQLSRNQHVSCVRPGVPLSDSVSGCCSDLPMNTGFGWKP
ncbi:unnamed protein product [Dicrocoelium dendriticum]|nr:unnamed protein product [Dicrocoelium dendriticum]